MNGPYFRPQHRTAPWEITTPRLGEGIIDISSYLPSGVTIRQWMKIEVLSGSLQELQWIPDTTAVRARTGKDTQLRILLDLNVTP